jgi:mercuric ion transport protein
MWQRLPAQYGHENHWKLAMSVNDAGHEKIGAPSYSPFSNAPKWFAIIGLVAGLGAVVASSCCVLPLGLIALGVGAGILGVINEIPAWRDPLLSMSAIAVAGGWGAWLVKRRDACTADLHCATSSQKQLTMILLIISTIIVVMAAGWEHIDPVLLKLFNGH